MKDVMATPLGELIASIGNGVADAQTALDEASLAKTLEMYSNGDDKMLELMRQIGYQPNFYVIPEAEVEANVSLALTSTGTSNETPAPGGIAQSRTMNRTKIYTTPTNAANSNRYNMQANASTKLKFKIVPVPPSNAMAAMRVVPDLIDKTEEEVSIILNQFQLKFTIGDDSGSGKVVTQTPEAGSIINEGEVITLDF